VSLKQEKERSSSVISVKRSPRELEIEAFTAFSEAAALSNCCPIPFDCPNPVVDVVVVMVVVMVVDEGILEIVVARFSFALIACFLFSTLVIIS